MLGTEAGCFGLEFEALFVVFWNALLAAEVGT